jgi:hypothetical protein
MPRGLSSDVFTLESDAEGVVDLAPRLAAEGVSIIVRVPGVGDISLPKDFSKMLASVANEVADGHSIVISRADDVVSPAAAGKMLGVSRTKVVQWINEGLLQDLPVGNDHRIPTASIRVLQGQRIAASQSATALVAATIGEGSKPSPRVDAARDRARKRMAGR